jgi:hypothetical protein
MRNHPSPGGSSNACFKAPEDIYISTIGCFVFPLAYLPRDANRFVHRVECSCAVTRCDRLASSLIPALYYCMAG